MAWTTPQTWTTDQLVTAADLNTHVRDNLNFLASLAADSETNTASAFTNTAYADLDALTAASFPNAVSVSVGTGTEVLIIISCSAININTSGIVFMGYRVSGATTITTDDTLAVRSTVTTAMAATFVWPLTGLTAGTNVFELQARVTSNSGLIRNPSLTVIPLA